jgi:hypothetical protein
MFKCSKPQSTLKQEKMEKYNNTYHNTVLIITPDNKQSIVTIYNRNFKNSMTPSLRTYVNAIDETVKKN